MPPPTSRQALVSHQTRHPLARTRDTLVPQFSMNAGTSIHLPTGVVDFLNVLCQLAGLPVDAYSLDASSRHSSHSATPQGSHRVH